MTEDNSPTRRNLLRLLGIAGSTTALGGLSASSASAAENNDENSFNVVGADLNTENTVQVSSTSISSTYPLIDELVSFMENKTGMESWTDSNLYIDVETDNAEANSYDPRVSVIPFGADSAETKGNNLSPNLSKAGFLFVFTVVENGERVPVGTYGQTAVGLPSGKYKKRSFGLKDESPTQFSNEVVDGPSSSGGVTTQDTIPCAACQVVVEAICAGVGGTIGQYACVAACSAAFGANFIAIFGCATICSALFRAVAVVGCATQTEDVCVYAQNNSPIGFGC